MTSPILPGQWITCNAPHGRGGLGLHVAALVESARKAKCLAGYSCSEPALGDDDISMKVSTEHFDRLCHYTPIRFSPGWKNFAHVDLFDRLVASKLNRPPETLVAFAGQALHSFGKARSMGTNCLELVAATNHVESVQHRHRDALRRYPFESSWLNRTYIDKALREYRKADRIQVATDHTRDSFEAYGVPSEKLIKVPLHPHPRYAPAATRIEDGVFRVVYVGALTVAKGVPLLVEAFQKLALRQSELILVGRWATRGMRKYLEDVMANDRRIKACPGDPLPHFRQASVYAHASYDDSFGYAPMEALSCGLPVVVSADTGMKEWVKDGVNGYIFPTGNLDALIACLRTLQRKTT